MLWILAVTIQSIACLGQTGSAPSPGRAHDATITRPPSGTYIEGWNIVGNGMTDIIASESVIDVTPFYNALGGTDICAAIQAALATSPNAQTIDARGVTGGSVTCAVSPFNGYSAHTGRLLLGGVLITTTVQWTLPNTFFWIEGIAPASGSATGSIIKANASSFSCSNGTGAISMTAGCPLVFVGGTGSNGDSFASGIRNVELDCSSLASCIGAGSVNVQEGGGLDTVFLTNQANYCVDFDANQKTGATGISNAAIRNVDCVMSSSATSSSVGVYVSAADGPAEISNVTVTLPGGGATIAECVDLDGARGAIVNYVHCEHAKYGEVIGDSHAVTGASIRGFTNGSSITTAGIYINNSGNTDISVETVELNSNTVPALIDNVNGITISPSSLAKYVMTSSGGTLITTDKATPSVLGQETLLGVPFTTLGSQANGTLLYCTNCKTGTTPCTTTGGTGALAVRQNSAWSCK
jgi:hypothetical protein